MKIEDPSLPSISSNVQSNEEQPTELIEVPPQILELNQISTENQEKETTLSKRLFQWMKTYIKKFCGSHEERPKRLPWEEYFWTFIASFLGIAAVAFFHFRLLDKYIRFSHLILTKKSLFV